jgi:hypothetical protein
MKKSLPVVLAMAGLLVSAQAQSGRSHHDMKVRGNQGMGFAQNKTTHHFFLNKDGGAIQVTANSATDKANLDHIRMHLGHIRSAFESGDFQIPGFVHDQTPPGVPEMTKLKDKIHYSYKDVSNGGRITITSSDAEAIDAIHHFLRFQITEHKTGDSLDLSSTRCLANTLIPG